MEPSAKDLLEQARHFRETRQHNKAVCALTSALVRLEPSSVQRLEVLHMRGVSWEQLELFEQASNDYTAALRLAEQLDRPTDQGKIYTDFALLMLKTNDFGGAVLAAQSAIDLLQEQHAIPELASAFSVMGRRKYVDGNDDNAHAYFRQAENLLYEYALDSPRRLYNLRLLIFLNLGRDFGDWVEADNQAITMARLARQIGDRKSLWLSRALRVAIVARSPWLNAKLEKYCGLKRRP